MLARRFYLFMFMAILLLGPAFSVLSETDGLAEESNADRLARYRKEVVEMIAANKPADTEDLVDLLNTLERSSPFDPFSHYQRAIWLESKGDTAAALFFYNAASGGKGSAEETEGLAREAFARRTALENKVGKKEYDTAYYSEFKKAYDTGKHSAAVVVVLSRVLRQSEETDPNLLIYRGDAYFRLKEYQKAIEDFEQSEELSGNGVVSQPLAECYLQTSRLADAEPLFSMLIEKEIKAKGKARGVLYVRLATCRIGLELLTEAAEALDLADKANDQTAPLEARQSVRGDLLLAGGDSDGAVRVWQETLDHADMFSPYYGELDRKLKANGGKTTVEESLDNTIDILKKNPAK